VIHSLVGCGLTRKHETPLESLVTDKRSRLLQTFVYKRRKKFYTWGPGTVFTTLHFHFNLRMSQMS